MTQLLETHEPLTREELEQVQRFAEFLLSRRPMKRSPSPVAGEPARKISFEGWDGCLAHVHPEMSDAEFKQLMMDERVRQALE